jgi:predicted RND superfamily exporter protein
MWIKLAKFVLHFRVLLLVILFGGTAFMTYYACQVELSYEFTGAIPKDNPKFKAYQHFKSQFGEDGNLLVIGMQTDRFFQQDFFQAYKKLQDSINEIPHVEHVLSVPSSMQLTKDVETKKLKAQSLFDPFPETQEQLDSLHAVFKTLPFYQGLLYNGNTYIMAIRIDKQILDSKKRIAVVERIYELSQSFGKAQQLEVSVSGLPMIRTIMATKVADELRLFLLISFLLTAGILFWFFRSFSSVWMSMLVVAMGVIWSLGSIVLLGYKITLLTGLIPPLMVVIGIPNCVYFLNKYHAEFAKRDNKESALIHMVERMGIVTLFTNISAAIGLGVFCLTQSQILKQFGVVAGLNIMLIFVISLVFLPAVLSFLPPPQAKHTQYLKNKALCGVLDFLERIVCHHKKWIYATTLIVLIFSFCGMWHLKPQGFIVDDIPQSDKLYQDLKFFEKHFKGVMPLEIAIDTRKKNGVISLSTLEKLDQAANLLAQRPEFAKPISVAEGIKFAKQAYYNGDPGNYTIPNAFDIGFLAPYLRMRQTDSNNQMNQLLSSFMDADRQVARLSVNMADVGSARLPMIIDSIKPQLEAIFDSSSYTVSYTGTSVIFLEGSRYIINGLTESIIIAFGLIMLCMLYLFRSWKMMFISLIPNVIPLLITAGIMGWMDIAIKPSTVLVFSVALGIAIDVTIRFLVNYKQELPANQGQIDLTVRQTIRDTGLSIIYTSLILFAGFMIFAFSQFQGTKALGWLTSLTLLCAMVTNLTILPVLLLAMSSKKMQKKANNNRP